jgi:hypothetical protein
MICSALVFAADMFAGLTEVEVKNRRRNEMVGNCFGGCLGKGGFAFFKYGGGEAIPQWILYESGMESESVFLRRVLSDCDY